MLGNPGFLQPKHHQMVSTPNLHADLGPECVFARTTEIGAGKRAQDLPKPQFSIGTHCRAFPSMVTETVGCKVAGGFCLAAVGDQLGKSPLWPKGIGARRGSASLTLNSG